MTNQQKDVVVGMKALIAALPAAQREAVDELTEHIRMLAKHAGEPVGYLAIATVCLEMQIPLSKL